MHTRLSRRHVEVSKWNSAFRQLEIRSHLAALCVREEGKQRRPVKQPSITREGTWQEERFAGHSSGERILQRRRHVPLEPFSIRGAAGLSLVPL